MMVVVASYLFLHQDICNHHDDDAYEELSYVTRHQCTAVCLSGTVWLRILTSVHNKVWIIILPFMEAKSEGSQLDKPRLFLVATNRVHVNIAVIINATVLYILVFMYLLEIKLLLLLQENNMICEWRNVH